MVGRRESRRIEKRMLHRVQLPNPPLMKRVFQWSIGGVPANRLFGYGRLDPLLLGVAKKGPDH